jgi:SAM-dependent methyltransferase
MPETMNQSDRTQLPMPPMVLRIMKDDDAKLIESGVSLAKLLYRFGLKSDDALLDVGCGYGRLPLGLLSGTDYHGQYLGFDVLPKHVGWCADELTPAFPNFRFHHLDVRNDRYNPRGKVDPARVRFPAKTSSIDFCALFSIFTHFYRADIERYLREMHRVLEPGATVVSTWFLFDEARLAAVTSERSGYPMTHRLDDKTIYNDLSDPLRAIAFDEAFVRSLVADAGLEVAEIVHGSWTGEPGDDGCIFQDVVVLRRPAATGDRVRASLSRVANLLRRGA